MNSEKISFNLNNAAVSLETDPETPLLYILRNDFGLNGAKFGCGSGQCMACMVLVDNRSLPSCQVPVSSVMGKNVTTLEGLAEKNGKLHKVQQAFVKEQAAQCGYCLNGMVINSVALLNENSNPTDQQIREHLNPHICRCGVHERILKAVKTAVEL